MLARFGLLASLAAFCLFAQVQSGGDGVPSADNLVLPTFNLQGGFGGPAPPSCDTNQVGSCEYDCPAGQELHRFLVNESGDELCCCGPCA